MKKRILALLLTGVMVSSVLTGCGSKPAETPAESGTPVSSGEPAPAKPVELTVTTTFAGGDGNAQNFQDGVKAWMEETGNVVNDASATSDETFKARVTADFEMGSEPDVLFYFNGVDSNPFVEAGKVMSIDDIRAEYPDYASNMKDEMMGASPVDGKNYSVPVNGYWEAMFVNTAVLDAAGVAVPGADYTWDQFLADCQKIKDAGFAPIAAALGNIPHYWFEFSIFNHLNTATHCQLPASIDDTNGQAWVAGMEDIKTLYEKGFFPENTLSGTDDETFQLFMNDKAAFLIDGSWKVGGIVANCQADPDDPATLDQAKLDKFTVTYIPGMGERKATDLIGGLSMGYYITKKAWDDPAKRDAAVSFVEYMTSNEMVPKFAQHTATALKEAPAVDTAVFNSLQVKAMEMTAGVTSLAPAVQDLIVAEDRTPLFDGMPKIVTGKVAAKDAVQECLDLIAAD